MRKARRRDGTKAVRVGLCLTLLLSLFAVAFPAQVANADEIDPDMFITHGVNQSFVAPTPAGISAESVAFPTAEDDGYPVDVVCDNPAMFPIGKTFVHCSATDPDEDSDPVLVVTTQFCVTVTLLDVHFAMTPGTDPAPVKARGPSEGASVGFAIPTASDDNGPVAVTCDHVPGTVFPIGKTTVNCTASDPDAAPSTLETSLTVTVFIPASVPTAPTNVTASAGNHLASVSFGAPDYNGSLFITGYAASCVSSDGQSSGSGSNPSSPVTVSGLLNGTSYTCTATASNQLGSGPPSSPSNAVVPDGIATCTNTQTCDTTASSGSSPTGAPQTVEVKGTPSAPNGSVELTIAKELSSCPGLPPVVAPVTTLDNSGFSSSTNLVVTVTQSAVGTGAGKICYTKDKPFLSETNPQFPMPGTALLLPCTTVGYVAPCQLSSTQTPTRITVTFLIPGGDPKFRLVVPQGLLLWPSALPAGKVGAAYSARLQSSGGKAPVRWKVASGKLAPGLSLNASGAITGKPKAKGVFKCQVKATDSGAPAKSTGIAVSITVK